MTLSQSTVSHRAALTHVLLKAVWLLSDLYIRIFNNVNVRTLKLLFKSFLT